MMITENTFRVTCDVKNCKNIADFTLPAKGRMGHFYICEECLKKLAKEYADRTVPKSPENAVKKAMKLKSATIRQMAGEV